VQFQKGVAGEKDSMDMPKPLEQMSTEELTEKFFLSKISTQTLKSLTESFTEEGFEWFLPVIFSKSTDPLWPDPGASIEKRIETEIYGETVRTTLSMIIHKLVACSLAYPKFFALSPNIRIEKRERRSTGWHTYEFTQLDFEARNASSSDIRSLVEKIFCRIIGDLKSKRKEELIHLGRYKSLIIPETPFKLYDREELEGKWGQDWESKLPKEINAPTWVVNIPREFYDFEDFDSGKWDNFDLILPKNGEVLSGAAREWQYDKIVKKIERDGVRKENYKILLTLAKEGRLKKTAGAGIGVERLVSWIVSAKHVGEVQPFPKIPGIVYEL
jgi:asparaginyl-tRNA synthetase